MSSLCFTHFEVLIIYLSATNISATVLIADWDVLEGKHVQKICKSVRTSNIRKIYANTVRYLFFVRIESHDYLASEIAWNSSVVNVCEHKSRTEQINIIYETENFFQIMQGTHTHTFHYSKSFHQLNSSSFRIFSAFPIRKLKFRLFAVSISIKTIMVNNCGFNCGIIERIHSSMIV